VRRIGVNWDVTDSRTADAARQAHEIAQRENLAKSQFLARMSHELRTPLNAVLGFAQLLATEERGHNEAAQMRRRRVQHIQSAGRHLLDLINDVLDLSSLESGEVRIALQPVPLSCALTQTLPLVEPLMAEHGVTLHVGDTACTVLADATRLRQVLVNLLSNAAKYNRPGGQVQVHAHADTVDGQRQVLIEVADTGLGMAPQQLAHLFEPFNRLGAERDGVEGTGIGLAIVKALVERMGGRVSVSSQPGEGSVFQVWLADGTDTPLPAATPSPSSRPVDLPTGPATSAAPRGTLLYIEDNPVNALIIAELIGRRSDLQLHLAADGEARPHLAGHAVARHRWPRGAAPPACAPAHGPHPRHRLVGQRHARGHRTGAAGRHERLLDQAAGLPRLHGQHRRPVRPRTGLTPQRQAVKRQMVQRPRPPGAARGQAAVSSNSPRFFSSGVTVGARPRKAAKAAPGSTLLPDA
jgi:two-component sensor histidine kinase